MVTPAHGFIATYTLAVTSYEVAEADLDLIKAAEDGSVVVIALAIVWFFVKRSDSREEKLRQNLTEQLDAERKAHEETRIKLLAAIQRKDNEQRDV